MTDSEYAQLANAVTSLDAAILAQMKRRAELKDKLRTQIMAATEATGRLLASSSGMPAQDVLVVLLSLSEINQIINDI